MNEEMDILTREYNIELATTDTDIESVKKIRENVYTSKYDQPTEFLNSIGVIFNEEDKQSFIYLLKHLPTNQYVGTVRVFFINEVSPLNKLPMQQTVKDDSVYTLLQKLPVVEISRLALISDLPVHNDISALKLRTLLSYKLMVATRISFMLYSSWLVFSIMENSLHRILKRQNVNFEPISESVDSYGTSRTPYSIERKKLLRDTEETMGKLTRHYLKQLCQTPDTFWKFVDDNPYLQRSDVQLDRISKLFQLYGDDVDLELLLDETKKPCI